MDVNSTGQGGQNIYNYPGRTVANSQNLQTSSVNQPSNENNLKYDEKAIDGVSAKDAKIAVDKINKLLEDKATHIEYEEDKNFKQVMVMKVIDNNTHEVINQIPSKQIMDMVAQFCEMAGLILDKKG